MEEAIKEFIQEFISSRCPLSQDAKTAEERVACIVDNYADEFTDEMIAIITTWMGEEVFEI